MEVRMSPRKSTWNILLILTGRPHNKKHTHAVYSILFSCKNDYFQFKKDVFLYNAYTLTPHYENLPCNI